ncbi:hypothetical protein CF319_g867 [Tilletia indica]|nr:hypothetical protein CF319_g867 [Tilletia indica]
MPGSATNPVVLSSSSPPIDSPEPADASTPTRTSRRSPARPWTVEQETALVDLIHDSARYQDAFLPGHHNFIPATNVKTSGATMLRAMSTHIFPPGQAKTADQVRSKIVHLIKRYRTELTSMTQTGQGLLLDEMRAGPIKNAREELLKNCPWWETMHAMMRDRSSSDPNLVVTGAGEINTGSSSTSGSNFSSPVDTSLEQDNQSQKPGDQSQDELVGLGILSPYSRRAAKRKFQDEDDQDDNDMDVTEDKNSQDSQGSSSSSATSGSGFSSSKLFIPTPGQLLPSLSALADRTNEDPMSRSTSTSKRGASPGPSNAKGKGKADEPSDLQEKKPNMVQTSKARSTNSKIAPKTATKPHADQAIDDLSRQYAEERHLRAQTQAQASIAREETRRFKLEIKSRDREAQTSIMEHRLDSLSAKLDAIQVQVMRNAQAISELSNSINTFTSKIDIMSMVLQHLPSPSKQ